MAFQVDYQVVPEPGICALLFRQPGILVAQPPLAPAQVVAGPQSVAGLVSWRRKSTSVSAPGANLPIVISWPPQTAIRECRSFSPGEKAGLGEPKKLNFHCQLSIAVAQVRKFAFLLLPLWLFLC